MRQAVRVFRSQSVCARRCARGSVWAGEMQGKHIIYLDAGSGARKPITTEMISTVSSHIEIPLFVGGGITTPEKVYENCIAGANIVVVGNAIERDPLLIKDMAQAARSAASSSHKKLV